MAEYACATKDEMRTFIKNLKVTTVLERIHEITESDGTKKNAGNLVIYFTPFPIKYINYLKTHQDKHKGRLHRTKQDVVYIQLLRYVPRWDTVLKSTLNCSTFRRASGWSDCHQAATKEKLIGKSRIKECVTFSGTRNKYAQSCPKFKYVLSPVDAARGYVVILRNFRPDTDANAAAESSRHCTMMYGNGRPINDNYPDGHFNFGRGVVGAITINGLHNTGKNNDTKLLKRSDIDAWLDKGVECNSKSLVE